MKFKTHSYNCVSPSSLTKTFSLTKTVAAESSEVLLKNSHAELKPQNFVSSVLWEAVPYNVLSYCHTGRTLSITTRWQYP